MESPNWVLLVALMIASSAIIHLVEAQNPEGFISLDCGLPPNEMSPYVDPETGLPYTSDSGFIQSGKIGRIQFGEGRTKMSTMLRYFPDGKRNCYTLKVKQGIHYLIRAEFTYGNYDGLNTTPIFDLHIGPNLWGSIDSVLSMLGSVEIMHAPKSDFLDVCLVKTGSTTPFISSLILRPQPKNSYMTLSRSLKTWTRFYFSESGPPLKYPDDAYDREWWPSLLNSDEKPISTNLKVNNSGSYFLPQVFITNGVTLINETEPLLTVQFGHRMGGEKDQFLIFLHFCEIQKLGVNETREFDILWNNIVYIESFSPTYLQPTTAVSPDPLTCEERGSCHIQLKKTTRSTLPPLLNAYEIYFVIDSPQSATNENDVLAIRNIKETYGLNKITWQGDPCVPKDFLWDGLKCNNEDMSTEPLITSLNLSSSGLTGTIAEAIQNLTYLEYLDLSDNSLVGAVPQYLANMKFLSSINLSKNNLNGSIPKALRDRQKRGLKIIFDGDDEKPSLAPKKKFPVLISIAVVVAVVVVIMVVVVLIFVAKRKKAFNQAEVLPKSHGNATSTDTTDPSIETKRKKFSHIEVMEMTKNLKKPLGEGGFGVVYYGEVNSSQVAVKLLSKSSAQGYKEFKAEVDLLLRVHHRNLVSLVGYCDERDHLALIYEYMPNMDLKHHLTGNGGASILDWSTRLEIAIGSAQGLEYLHNGCQPSMVHRDIKCTNILLNNHITAKIADFGLSRSFQVREESPVSTVVAGTPGYLDPEYYRTGRLAERSDVYSFGVVLLEIMTNQLVIDQTREQTHITEWMTSMLNRGDITKIMDPNLNGGYNTRSVWRAVELAMLCANPSSEYRPNMSQVVVELKECLNSENMMRSNDQDKDSQSSREVSMSFDTQALPSAR